LQKNVWFQNLSIDLKKANEIRHEKRETGNKYCFRPFKTVKEIIQQKKIKIRVFQKFETWFVAVHGNTK